MIKEKIKKIKILQNLVWIIRALIEFNQGTKNKNLDKKLPWMGEEATKWLKNYLKKNMSVFEWGSGGSTLFIAEKVKYLISIEHNYNWYIKTKTYLKLNCISNCKYKYIPAETTGNADFASTDKNFIGKSFEKYCRSIDNLPDESFDLVIVDGRARPSCVIQAKNKVKANGYILLDNSERKEYISATNSLREWKRTDFVTPDSTTSIFQKIKSNA